MASKKKTSKQTSKTSKSAPPQTTPVIETVVPTPDQPDTDTLLPVEEIPAPTHVEVPTPPTEEMQDATLPTVETPVESPVEVPTPPTDETVVPANDTQVPTPEEEPKVETPLVEQTTATKKPKVQNEKALSAINAAARVLAREGKPMSCKELIGVMAIKGLWRSPGGVTPHATLYAAITREIQTEGEASRFVKVGRGMFAINPKITEDGAKPKKAAKATKAEQPSEPNEPTIPDGTEGPESLKELFRLG